MATFTLFHEAMFNIGAGIIILGGGSAHTFKAMLTTTTPVAATQTVKADFTEITPGNGYTAGGFAMTTTFLETAAASGVWRFQSTVDPTWTASGGSIATHRYLIVYDDTSASDSVLGYVDRGTSDVIADGNTRTWDVGSSGLFEISATP